MPETGGSSPERGAGGCMTTRLLASHTGVLPRGGPRLLFLLRREQLDPVLQ